MRAGIVGLPNVGKSTLFNALTYAGAEASNCPFCTIEPNVGVMLVPDPRLEIIHTHIPAGKVVPAHVELVDIAGLVRGAGKGEGLGNKFLSHIREVDAIIEVVRCFDHDDIAHVEGALDPLRDMETIETELMLADLEQAETALAKANRLAIHGDREAKERAEMLERCRHVLAEGKPVRTITFEDEAHRKLLRGMGMLTHKRVLFAANVGEDDLAGAGERVQAVRDYAAKHGGEVVVVSAELEAELAELEEPDRTEMLASLGLSAPALHRVARAALDLLGLITFFTTGDKEIRARTLARGATAPEAAGDVHTDMQRGFIRVEVTTPDLLEQFASEHALRDAGKLRVEGKHYVVRDGDICRFLFN